MEIISIIPRTGAIGKISVSIATRTSIPGKSWEIIYRKKRNNVDAKYQKRVIENPIIDAGY